MHEITLTSCKIFLTTGKIIRSKEYFLSKTVLICSRACNCLVAPRKNQNFIDRFRYPLTLYSVIFWYTDENTFSIFQAVTTHSVFQKTQSSFLFPSNFTGDLDTYNFIIFIIGNLNINCLLYNL